MTFQKDSSQNSAIQSEYTLTLQITIHFDFLKQFIIPFLKFFSVNCINAEGTFGSQLSVKDINLQIQVTNFQNTQQIYASLVTKNTLL